MFKNVASSGELEYFSREFNFFSISDLGSIMNRPIKTHTLSVLFDGYVRSSQLLGRTLRLGDQAERWGHAKELYAADREILFLKFRGGLNPSISENADFYYYEILVSWYEASWYLFSTGQEVYLGILAIPQDFQSQISAKKSFSTTSKPAF